ncbi:MAG: hypothetical protein DRQ14_09785, partial [Candidatus Latescibacterota bacterium]
VGSEVSFEVKPTMTVLPSITELGMAALLPGAQEGLSLAVENGRLAVCIGDESVGSLSERRAYFERHLGRRGKVVALEELEREDLSRVQLLVVLCRQIDEFGSFAADLHPRGLLEMVGRVARSVRYVAEKGFERIWVVSDHGFLFVPPEVRLSSLSAPEAPICKRRFAVGGSQGSHFNVRAEELGLKGSALLSFPEGLSVFGLPGEAGAFLHGGLSLQECVVAVLQGQVVAPVKKVGVRMSLPETLTGRLAVIRVEAEASSLFDRPRQVQVVIGERRSDPIQLGPDRPMQDVSLRWLDDFEEPPPQVKVSLQDVETGEVLEERTVRVEVLV